MKFREHRGTLEDSLETIVEIPSTRKALFLKLKELFMNVKITDITMGYYGFDKRLNEDVYSVHINTSIVGFTDTLIAGINAR